MALMFPTKITEVTFGELLLRIHEVETFDDVLEYYVETAPTEADMIPYYSEIWPAALGLAEWMVAHRDLWPHRRVLELGCGLGLPSLVAQALGAQVTATDYHPDNGPFFLENARMNGLADIGYVRMDWRQPALRSPFDIVIGSDLIYEEMMITPLASCLPHLCSQGGLFLLSDPGRPHLQHASTCIENAGFASDISTVDNIFVVEFRREQTEKN